MSLGVIDHFILNVHNCGPQDFKILVINIIVSFSDGIHDHRGNFMFIIDMPRSHIEEAGGDLVMIVPSQELLSFNLGIWDMFSILWSTGDTTQIINNVPAGDYWCTLISPCGDTSIAYYGYDIILEAHKESFFSHFGSQIRLLEDGEMEVYNALGQKLLGTREREFYLSTPGLYILKFRSVSGAVRTAKIVL